MVGAPSATVGGILDEGTAYVFTYVSSGSGHWGQSAELTESSATGVTVAAHDEFGASVAIEGACVVVGATGSSYTGASNPGEAFVFTNSGSGWGFAALLSSDDGATGDMFGSSVAIGDNGQIVVVGAPAATRNGNNGQGRAYLFYNYPNGWAGAMTQGTILVPTDFEAGEMFGSSVSVSSDGKTVVVGGPGDAESYVFSSPNLDWLTSPYTNQMAILTPTGTVADFGASVSIGSDDEMVLVGAPGGAFGGLPTAQGAAYQFTDYAGGWTQAAKLTAADGAVGDFFGSSVAINGTTLVVGAPGINIEQGATDVFGPTAPAVTGFDNSIGPADGGNTVTITGTGFTGATVVDFGTVAATNVTVVSDTQITATAPAPPQDVPNTVDVTVTCPTGTSATSSADLYSYVGFKLISPASGTSFAAGQTILIQWTTANVPASGRLGLYYGTATSIVNGLSASSGGSYAWNTAGLRPVPIACTVRS